MDLIVVANEVVLKLTPFLPYLARAGTEVAEAAGKAIGAAAWELSKAIWAKLKPRVDARPAAKEAVADIARDPSDSDTAAALRRQLKKIFEEDPNLLTEIAGLLDEARDGDVIVTASGDGSVAIGGNVNGSSIVTGNQNTVGEPRE
jgi:hypothetical protein